MPRPANSWPAPTVPAPRPVDTTPVPPLAARRPPAGPISVTHEQVVTGSLAEILYEQYVDSVAPLAELAVLRHLDSKPDVLAMLANPRISKMIAWQGGEPVGLALLTNSLEDVTELSPQFLRARFPEHAARDAIYVAMLVIVSKHLRGLTVFSRLYTEMWQVPARANGVLVFDVCEFNRTTFDADNSGRRVAEMFPRSTFQVLDRQTWYVAELPEPLPGPQR